MHDCCCFPWLPHIRKLSKDSVIIHDTAAAAAAASGTQRKNIMYLVWDFHCSGWLWVGGTSPRHCLPDFATMSFERPAYEPLNPNPKPHLHRRGVQASPVRASTRLRMCPVRYAHG